MLKQGNSDDSEEESIVLNDYLSQTTAFHCENAQRNCACSCHHLRSRSRGPQCDHSQQACRNHNNHYQNLEQDSSFNLTVFVSKTSEPGCSNSSLCCMTTADCKRSTKPRSLRPRRNKRSLKHERSDLNNHNELKIDWVNLDKKEFMKLVGSLNVVDLFAEVASDCVKYSEGSKKWHMAEYVLQRKDRRIFVGGQGFVLFVRRRQHSSSLAMKVCLHNTCRTRMDRYQLKANLQIAAQRESRFISDLLVYYMTSKFFISVMYKAKHSSLKVIKREIGNFPGRYIKYYTACVLSAIFRLHRIGICHKDIKADNVLIDHRGVPQLADFGLAVECRLNYDGYVPNRRVTTMQYYPPECLVLGGKVNDYKIDSWLFGFFVSEIYIPSSSHMWGKFQGTTKDGWRFLLCDGCHLNKSKDDESLGRLLRSLLRQDPNARPCIKEAMKYAYFHDISWRQLESELPPEGLHVKNLLTTEKGDIINDDM